MHTTRLSLAAALFFVAVPAFAQPGRGPGGPGTPEAFADRILESRDSNGDGKLGKDEMGAPFVERVFPLADANNDGYLDREELIAYSRAQMEANRDRGGPGARPGAPGGAAGAAAEAPSFHESMEDAGRALRGLRRSEFDGASRESDLAAIDRLQHALLGAKATIGEVEMSEAAKARFGDDVKAYRRSFHLAMVRALIQTLEIESAVVEGNSEAAKAALAALRDTQGSSHDLFQPEDEDEGPVGRPGRPGTRPGGGRPGSTGGGGGGGN